MKLLIFLLFALSLQCQTYKLDLGGIPNQYPTQIEVVDGDVIIATTENLGKGYGIDAVSLINVNKNKVFRVANSSRQTRPVISTNGNEICLTHWEITGSGVDAGQIIFLNSNLDLKNKQQLYLGNDTEIYSSIRFNDNYFLSGALVTNSFIAKLNNNSIVQTKLYSKSNSSNGSMTYLFNYHNQLLCSYFNRDYMGLMIIDTNLKIIFSKDYEFSKEVKLSFNVTNINNNIYVFSDNYNKDFTSLLGTSLHIFNNNLDYLGEYYIRVKNNRALIKQIKSINNYLYIVGSYMENNFLKSFVCQLDSNLQVIKNYNCNEFNKLMSITNYNLDIFLCGMSNMTNDYNGDIYYTKVNKIENLCNSYNISDITTIEKVNDLPKQLNNNFSVSNLTNIGYQDPSYSLISTKSTEICKPISNNIDFQLLKIDYKSPCSIDSVGIEIVPSSSNINVVWFDGSQLKKRYFSKNGTYKVTLTIPGVKDTTFDVNINSIYKGSASGNLTFTPDTLLFANSDIEKLTCQIFTLTNVGIDTVTLSELTYLKKLNFSSPNSIFPITLFPKESKDLEVCFYGNRFKTNYTDSIRFDNCNNPKFLTLLADIPEDTLNFATRCMLKFNAAAPSKSIIMTKPQLNELVLDLQSDYKLSNLLGLELFDIYAILPNQLVYLETRTSSFRILVIE